MVASAGLAFQALGELIVLSGDIEKLPTDCFVHDALGIATNPPRLVAEMLGSCRQVRSHEVF